jgi:molybdopterin adenylyltransferase
MSSSITNLSSAARLTEASAFNPSTSESRASQESSAGSRSQTQHAPLTAAVVTVSDSCARGERVDASGPAVVDSLANSGFRVVATKIVPDDSMQIQNALLHLALEARLIVTTGGTGIAPRDVTPEATAAVCERLIDGVAERMRIAGAQQTPFAALSRGLCGVHDKTLILNLPGSPKGAVESLASVVDLIPHALDLLDGKTGHT